MTFAETLMLSEALTQFIENANDPEERAIGENINLELAENMLARVDAVIATWSK